MAESPDVTSPRIIQTLFEQYGLSPRRQLGQNFLIDANIVRKIAAALEIAPGDAVLEVGPGAGALTLTLAQTEADLVILEIDRGMVRLLKGLLKSRPEVRIIEKDVLKFEWTNLAALFKPGAPVKLVSNLPYNISGPFIYGLLKAKFPFSMAVIMLQKEVARRLVSEPFAGEYGGLSVLAQYYTEAKMLFAVSRNVFWPRPAVGSAVVKLQPRRRLLKPEEERFLWKLVQKAFQQRRKTLLKSTAGLLAPSRHEAINLLAEAAIDPGARPEQLTVDQFAKLARITYNYDSKLS